MKAASVLHAWVDVIFGKAEQSSFHDVCIERVFFDAHLCRSASFANQAQDDGPSDDAGRSNGQQTDTGHPLPSGTHDGAGPGCAKSRRKSLHQRESPRLCWIRFVQRGRHFQLGQRHGSTICGLGTTVEDAPRHWIHDTGDGGALQDTPGDAKERRAI